MSAELIAKMRGRIDQCRRLARSTTDEHAARVLQQMAEEGEADLAKLIAAEGEAPVETIIQPQPPQA